MGTYRMWLLRTREVAGLFVAALGAASVLLGIQQRIDPAAEVTTLQIAPTASGECHVSVRALFSCRYWVILHTAPPKAIPISSVTYLPEDRETVARLTDLSERMIVSTSDANGTVAQIPMSLPIVGVHDISVVFSKFAAVAGKEYVVRVSLRPPSMFLRSAVWISIEPDPLYSLSNNQDTGAAVVVGLFAFVAGARMFVSGLRRARRARSDIIPRT